VQEIVLGGDRDPTQFELAEGAFRLLKVGLKGSSRPNYVNIAAFFKGNDPTCQAAADLAKFIQQQTKAHTVEIQIRRDTWFASPWFPLLFRFEPDDRPIVYANSMGRIIPPKVWQYYELPHVAGYWNAGAFSCDKYDRCEHIP